MKKSIILLALTTVFVLSFSSCSKDEFNYPMEMLYGTWKSVEIKDTYGMWQNISSSAHHMYWFYIYFQSNGTHSTSGSIKTEKGLYKAEKDMIHIYSDIDGKEYMKYKVISMNESKAELRVFYNGSSIDIRVEKLKSSDKPNRPNTGY